MPRLEPAPVEGPDADRRNVERIAGLRGGRVSTLFRMLLHSGDLAAGWCELGTAVRWHSSLDDRLRELVTCFVARATGAEYEWRSHAPLARSAGVSDEQLACLPDWHTEPSFAARDRAALRLAAAVLDGTVDDGVFEAAAEHLDTRELVELAATTAYYLAISRFLQACDVTEPLPE